MKKQTTDVCQVSNLLQTSSFPRKLLQPPAASARGVAAGVLAGFSDSTLPATAALEHIMCHMLNVPK